MKDFAQWEGFEGSRWKEQINVRDFIRHNYTPYDGDDSFLEGPTEALTNCGESCRSCRKQSVPTMVCLTWRQRLSQA